ncbi:MAG: hypothetical protein DCF13_10440 [Flavobacteriaceae bacterium]|nr:MAG: hypothetical protein DCF13_10440 [Flavobacteriaceae bacterium]
MKLPIDSIIRINNIDIFHSRIEELQNLKNYEINFNLFYNIIINLRNGCNANSSPKDWNTFTHDEWCEFLKKFEVIIKPIQIDLIFQYLMVYHIGLLSYEDNNKKIRANFNYNPSEENYVFEMIALSI